MQKGERNKLKLLLVGIRARLEQNRDYFIATDFIFQSGKKKFQATLKLDETQNYTLVFQGTSRPIDPDEAVAFFENQIDLYDRCTLNYTERGTMISILVTEKGVTMKQSERSAPATGSPDVNHPLLDHGRKYLIQIDRASDLLREIGILTAEGKLKNDMIRKYNQIDHYVELVAPMFVQDARTEIL